MPDIVDASQLAVPLPTPAPLGEAQQPVFAPAGGFSPTQQGLNATLAATQQGTVTPGYGGGGPVIQPMDMSLQSNVMGAVGLAPQEDTTTVIPDYVDPTEKQTEEFVEAHEEGGDAAAKKSKREDRKADKQERKGEFRTEKAELKRQKKAGEITGEERRKGRRGARKEKRRSRKAEKDVRKQAWKDYKTELEVDAYEAAD